MLSTHTVGAPWAYAAWDMWAVAGSGPCLGCAGSTCSGVWGRQLSHRGSSLFGIRLSMGAKQRHRNWCKSFGVPCCTHPLGHHP